MIFYGDTYLKMGLHNTFTCFAWFTQQGRRSAICVFTAPRKKQANEGGILGLLFYVRFYTFSAKKGQDGLQIQSAIQGLGDNDKRQERIRF